jgi:hypothetical protein
VVHEDDAACGPPGTVGSLNVGQTFIPRTDRIWRMDFAVANHYNAHVDPRPGIVRIFKWQAKGYFATVATDPLFVQHVDLTTDNINRIRLYPDLRFRPEEQDDTYFIEFSIPGKDLRPPRPARSAYIIDAVRATVDPYPDGSLYRSCTLWDGPRREGPPGQEAGYWWDLWFEFYGVTAQPPVARPLHPSDPQARWYEPLDVPSGDLRDLYWRRVNDYARWHRRSSLEPGSRAAHFQLFDETVLYLACKDHDQCPPGLDFEELLENVQIMFQRAVAERAACRDPQYPDCYIDFIQLFSPGLAVLLLREAGALEQLPAELRTGIRDLIFKRTLERSWAKREYGTNAWALSCMVTYLMFHVLYPAETPQAWIDYYQTVWKSFWDMRETEIDSENYQLLAFYFVLLVARYAPDAPDAARWYTDVWSHPDFRKLIDRFQETVTPIGTYPNYGDGTGVSPAVPVLMWMFEEAAVRFDAPAYRETARRLYDYNARRARSRPPAAGRYWDSLAAYPTFHGLALAYRAAGDAPVPDPPPRPGSLYTLRRRATRNGFPRPPAPAYTFSASATPAADVPPSLVASAAGAQTRHYVPDKLILRSGSGRDGLSFVFNLLNGYSHGHPAIGSLASFTDDGSILMMDGPYYSHLYAHRPEDESGPVLRHYRGGIVDFAKRGTDVEMARFAEGAAATVAWITFGDLSGWQVRQQRHFLFAKDRFLLVRDGFEAGPTRPGGIEVAVGPVWHAANVHPSHDADPDASDWYDVYDRQPVGNTTRFRNPERYSLLYFVGRSGHATAAYEEGGYLTLADSSRAPRSLARNPACAEPADPLTPVPAGPVECRTTPPFVLYQMWSGTLQTGESRWFDSLLLPHGRSDPAAVAANVHELAVGDDYTALQVDVGDEKWIVVDNPSRRNVSAGRLAGALATGEPYLTNAEYLMLRFAPGKPVYLMVSRADFVHTGVYSRAFSPAASGELEAEVSSR